MIKQLFLVTAIEKWLQANPEIGTLNGGKFYKFVDGKQVAVTPPRKRLQF